MRIVHVITRLILGGAQENTVYNVEDLVEHYGDDVVLITGPPEGPEGDLFDRTKSKNLDVRLLDDLVRPVRPVIDGRAYQQLVRLFRDLRPEVVHTHSSKAGILGRAAAHHCGIPCIVHTIHGLPFHPFERWHRNLIYTAAERWAAKRCHRIITVAEAMTVQALQAKVGRPEQYVTIYSGMEVEPFLSPPVDRQTVRAQWNFKPDEIVIAKVARLFELKGHDDVLAAGAVLIRQFPQIRLLFIGGGIWRERLQVKAESLGIGSNVIFTGLVPPGKIPELLSASDIVVHASYREGLARVLPQALLSGKPVVSYAVDGAPEVVLPDQTGYLATVGNIEELTEGLRKLIVDPEKRRRFGETGRQLFTEQFRHETMTARIRQLYEEVLAKPSTVQLP